MNQALLGTDLHDLSRLIAGQQKVSAALSRDEGTLKDLITNFNITMGALASQEATCGDGRSCRACSTPRARRSTT